MYIHQALHGYQQGHNKISCSMVLPNIDEERMKILSDWSEFAGSIDGDMSYITAYPLSQSNLYVVAKTWYANEMSRPGCVWTHSLIIDLSNIEDSFDFRQLSNCFHRPPNDNFPYDTIIEIDNNSFDSIEKNISLGINDVCMIYSTLLQDNSNSIITIENTSAYYQNLILSLLQYLPIEEISNLRICSGTSTMRYDGTKLFNLVFSSTGGNRLSSIPFTKNNEEANEQIGIRYICNSICQNNRDTYQLIRLFSKDIANNFVKLNTLGILLQALNSAYNGVPKMKYSALLDIITREFPIADDGKILKRIFLGIKVGRLFTTEEEYYLSLCGLPENTYNDWQSIDFETAINKYVLESYCNFTSLIGKLITMESLNSEGEKIIMNAANTVPLSILKVLCQNEWTIYIALVTINPNLLIDNYWLSLPINRVSGLIQYVEKINPMSITYWEKLLMCILINKLEITTSFAINIHKYYFPAIVKIMDYMQENNLCSLPSKINELCISNKTDVILWMDKQNALSNNIINFIMANINPTSNEVKKIGFDNWNAFFNSVKDSSDINCSLYLFRLSLNWKSAKALSVLKTSFYTIYLAMGKDKLSYKDFYLLNPYMVELPFWQSWDNCKKLRKGLVKQMKRLGYSHKDLIDFTPSKDLNSTLLKIWEKNN